MAFSMSAMDAFFKGDDMSDSVLIGLNRVAEIYGRPPLSEQAAVLYVKATGIEDERTFLQKLLGLLKTKHSFPVPADFVDPADED